MVNRAKASVDLGPVFAALAHPIRRAIVEQLAGGDATVGELAEPHKVSLPAISKHLRVLEDAGWLKVNPRAPLPGARLAPRPPGARSVWLSHITARGKGALDRLA